jgi:hypothetical protein
MKTIEDAIEAYERATRHDRDGHYEESLKEYLGLMLPDPSAYQYFNIFQRTYVLGALVELARHYAPAQAALDGLLQEKRLALSLAPQARHLRDDVASMERGIASLARAP